jgi:uncharacterized membrane protein YccC
LTGAMIVEYSEEAFQNPFVEEGRGDRWYGSAESMNQALSHERDDPQAPTTRPRLREVLRSLRVFNSLRICLAVTICVCISAWFRLPLCFESVIGVIVLFSV